MRDDAPRLGPSIEPGVGPPGECKDFDSNSDCKHKPYRTVIGHFKTPREQRAEQKNSIEESRSSKIVSKVVPLPKKRVSSSESSSSTSESSSDSEDSDSDLSPPPVKQARYTAAYGHSHREKKPRAKSSHREVRLPKTHYR